MSAIPGKRRVHVLKIKSPEAAAPPVCDHAAIATLAKHFFGVHSTLLQHFFVFIHFHKHALRKQAHFYIFHSFAQ